MSEMPISSAQERSGQVAQPGLPHPPQNAKQSWMASSAGASSSTTAPGANLAARRPVMQGRLGQVGSLITRGLTPRRVAQLQGALYALSGVWTTVFAVENPLDSTLRMRTMLSLAAASALWLLASRPTPPGRRIAVFACIAAVTQALWSATALGQAPLGWPFGIGFMVQLALAGWWVACASERQDGSHLDETLQPRPGRPLYP